MIYRISDLKFDLDRHELSRDGQPIKLTKLDFKMFRALVEASPALVRHDDLITQVWGPDRVITPENLSQRLKTLRKALGDDPADPVYIESIRGQGLRLIPEVKLESSGFSDLSLKPVWAVGLIGLLAVLLLWLVADWMDDDRQDQAADSVEVIDRVRQPAIAILPFANLSGNPANQFFTDGIHDDLLTRISKIQDIKTISRTSVMTYQGSDKKLGTIADELGVTTILEGGVQRAGDQVRINLQLIDAETDAHMWAHTYTRELTASNVFAVQAEITEAVANALQAILSEEEQRQLTKQPTNNLRALDAYFLGNQYYSEATSDGMTLAIAAYQEAVELDPGFAQAHSKLAIAMLDQTWYSGLPYRQQLEKSRPLIDQAILLDPQSSDAFIALARWYEKSGDVDKAQQAYEQAMKFGPNNAFVLARYGSLMQWELANPAGAIDLLRKAVELDPQNPGLKIQLAEIMSLQGLASEAIPMMEGVLEKHPDSSGWYRVLAQIHSSGASRHDKAIKAMRRAFELDPDHPANSYWNAIMHWRLGDFENTTLWMNHAAKVAPESEETPDYLGWAHIAKGDFEEADQAFARSEAKSTLHWLGLFTLGRAELADARPNEALNRYTGFAPRFEAKKSFINFSYGVGAMNVYLALGKEEKAEALKAAMMSVIEADPPLTYHGAEIMDASLYAVSGDPEAALAILGRWIDGGGASAFLKTQSRYELEPLADDPRFLEMLSTVRGRLDDQMTNLARWEESGEMASIAYLLSDECCTATSN